jgi:TRAP-type C4-dicarboxylate transport system permease small subunit
MKSRIVAGLWRISKAVNIAVAIPLVAAGFLMVAVVIAGTVARYVFNAPLIWSETSARYLMIWIGLVGASVALRHGDHIAIDVVRIRLPRALRHVGDLVVALAVAWFLWVMTVEGWAAAMRGANQMSPALGLSMFWPLALVPVAGALILVQHVLHTALRLLDGDDTGDHLPGAGAI